MKLSPAPKPQRPDGAACSSAHGAGVQFATGPIHGMRVPARDCLPATTMQNRYRVGGIQRRWVWIGTVGPVKDGHANAGLGTEWHGQTWQHVTPRHGGNLSRLDSTCLGWVRQCSAGRGNNATRGDTAGQFSKARRGRAGSGLAWLHATQSGIWDNFSGCGCPRRVKLRRALASQQRHRGRQSRTFSQAPRSTRITRGNG